MGKVREVAPYPGAPYYEPQSPEAEYEFRREQHEHAERNGDVLRAQSLTPWGSNADVIVQTPTQLANADYEAAESRAIRGGLPDAPDDGGPRATSSKPFRF